MKEHYGYLRGTEGADGDHVNCYLGPDLHASTAYVVDQFALPSRRFDEHKCMLGFSTQQEAERAYERSFSDGKGRERMGKVTPMPMERFKAWVKTDATKARTVRAAGGRVGEDTRSFMVSPQPGLGGLAMASVNLAGLGGLGDLDLSSATRSDDSGDRARLTGDRDRRMADDMKEHHRQRHAMGGPHPQAR